MSKVVLILDSQGEGKQKLDIAIKHDGYKVFHVNQDFSFNEIEEIINVDLLNAGYDVMVLSGCSEKISRLLQDTYEFCFNILVTNDDNKVKNNKKYCKALNYKDVNFYNDVSSMMRILTKDF